MNTFSNWWNAMSAFEQILWGIALGFSLFFLLQTILTAVGGDHEAEMAEGDADDSAMGDDGMEYQYLSLKNVVAFFTMFGWTGIASYRAGLHPALVLLIATACGVLMVILMMYLFRFMAKMRHSGTMNLKNAVGHSAEVYLHIPAKREGQGKISILFQGSLRELNAITDDPDNIPTGKIVKVTGLLNENVLIVSAH